MDRTLNDKAKNSLEVLSSDEEQIVFQDDDVETIMTIHEEKPRLVDTPERDPLLLNLLLSKKGERIKSENDSSVAVMPPFLEPSILCIDDYTGPYNFQVCIGKGDSKTPWEYSMALNKLYITMRNGVPFDFLVKNRSELTPLFVRVTPVYKEAQFSQLSVYRCISHGHPLCPSNRDVSPHVLDHVIRCNNPHTLYVGNRQRNERLSMIVPLAPPQMGTEYVREVFEFVCQNSCLGGMNRRPIQIIFTLEDSLGKTQGRRALDVRICACPKRDKEKDEQTSKPVVSKPWRRKRKQQYQTPETVNGACAPDLRKYMIQVPIIGKQNYEAAIKYVQDLMAGEVLRHTDDKSEAETTFRRCYTEVSSIINQSHESPLSSPSSSERYPV